MASSLALLLKNEDGIYKAPEKSIDQVSQIIDQLE